MTEKSFLDVERARRETPGCEHVVHFNNAGAGLMPQPVRDAMLDHLRVESEIGGYEAEFQAQEKIEQTYHAAAKLIGAKREEIAIVENATRAWDMAFYSIPFTKGDRILTAQAEYVSNYIAFLQVAQKTEAVIEVIPNDEHGQVSVKALSAMVDEKVKLIAITHVPTNGGLVNPAIEIGKIARQAGALYLLDACQSIGQIPINVNDVGCTMLSTTGRKYLRGPRGIGFLYVRQNIAQKLEPPFLDLHAATWVEKNRYEIQPNARRFENWESNCAAKIGLGVAIDYALTWGLEPIWQRVSSLAELLRVSLKKIPKIRVEDLGKVRCGIVTFTVKGTDPTEIRNALWKHRINVWISTIEMARLNMEPRGLQSVVRASVHYYNSEAEIERFCEALGSLINS